MNRTAAIALALALFSVPGLAQQPAQQAPQQQPADSAAEREFKRAVDAFSAGDNESAWFLFWSLAQAGDAKAQFNLAQMYRLGKGIPLDLALARRWYEAAASKNHPTALFLLGVMYENGHGVPRDISRARSWYQRSAGLNYQPAKEALDQLGPARR